MIDRLIGWSVLCMYLVCTVGSRTAAGAGRNNEHRLFCVVGVKMFRFRRNADVARYKTRFECFYI